MAEVMADGVQRGKGDLSTALRATVDARLRPWCPGCGADHVDDALFRLASLPAGLRLTPNGDGSADFVAGPPWPAEDPSAARRELVRRFLRYAGPTSRDGLAAWLALSPAAARRWWDLADVVPVEVDGRRLFLHPDDLPRPVPHRPPGVSVCCRPTTRSSSSATATCWCLTRPSASRSGERPPTRAWCSPTAPSPAVGAGANARSRSPRSRRCRRSTAARWPDRRTTRWSWQSHRCDRPRA